ncbi:alpha/beta-hydrolase [Colletotrichum zoysiae]|uniref:Alpha/beta-hydrolase n=1 Tax=Colletotrichum zoysiae TaxID=1216348 RepID=A0AAD9H7L9_9PEZI|nr:alpha/beta-hydrolase [Colletotrichum zoysiae]
MTAKSCAESIMPHRPAHSQRRDWCRPLVLVVVLLSLWTWKLGDSFHARNAILHPPPDPFPVFTDWDDVPTSEELRWVRCILPGMIPTGRGYMCARLIVPMDYQRPLNQSSGNPKVHIAMVLLPAPGHGLETGRFSESPLLVNPGGPGGSGTSFMLPPYGPSVQLVAGGTLDVIGFDPRGIGATTPRADCFVDTEPGHESSTRAKNLGYLHRLTWLAMGHDVGLLNTTAAAEDQLVHRSKALSNLCSLKDGEAGGFRYMATPNVAADMKTIIQAHDAWLKRNEFDTIPLSTGRLTTSEAAPPSTKGKLVYWGFSYGTLLGQTFAAMYPHLVGRLILDGVVESGSYDSPTWIRGIQDADAVLDKFFYFCHLARNGCALFRDGDDGPAPVKERYEHVMAKLRDEPITGVSTLGQMPVVLMEADIKRVVFSSLYSPVKTFPLLANFLNRLFVGDDISDSLIVPDFGFIRDPNFKLPVYPEESSRAISCSDGRYRRNETWGETFNKVSKYSTSVADVFTTIMMFCEGWDIEAKFPSPDWDANLQSPDPVNTSFPILFAGNTHDPVTPLSSAVKMSRNFVNAAVFELEAEGHCTIATASLCAITKIRDYLQKGIVPTQPTVVADGTLSGWDKCKADERPWKPFIGGPGEVEDGVRAEDLHALQGLRDVHDKVVGSLTPPLKLRLD